MSEEKDVLRYTIFGDRPVIGDLELQPLTAGRVALLQEMGNPLFLEGLKEGDELGAFPMMEVLFVAIKSSRDLAEASEEGEREWRVAVREFGMDLDNEVLMDAWEVFEKEAASITGAQAKKKRTRKKTAKRRR